LQDALLARLAPATCRLGIRIDEVTERGGKAVIRTGGATLAEADLAVVADGIHSSIATVLLGNAPVYRGYGAVIGIGRSSGDGLEPGLAQEFWGERDRFGLLDAGDGRRYWFYMAPFARAEGVAALDHAAIAERARGWPAAVRAAVAGTDVGSLIHIPIRSRSMPGKLGRGRIICIGDAAHAMEPNQGQGGCQGIEDAWLLGRLAQRLPPEALLAELEARRLPRVRGYWRDSAIVGRAAHSPSAFERLVSQTTLRLAPKQLDRRRIAARHTPPNHG
jgi:2-polyprenyl-6-methoxyphenol hydroxylase-like FAD-dependent oxidoreductase